MNFLNALLIGLGEWSWGPRTTGPLDKGDGAEEGEPGLVSSPRHEDPQRACVCDEHVLPQEAHSRAPPGDGASQAKRQGLSPSF